MNKGKKPDPKANSSASKQPLPKKEPLAPPKVSLDVRDMCVQCFRIQAQENWHPCLQGSLSQPKMSKRREIEKPFSSFISSQSTSKIST